MKTTFRDLLRDPTFEEKVNPQIREFKCGEPIIQEGTLGTEVYLMLKGKAEVYMTVGQLDKSGRRAGIARIAENEILGELSMFDDEPRTASVMAITDCEVAVINGRALIEYMDLYPAQGYWVLREVVSQIVQRMRQTTLRSNTITALYLNDYSD